MIGTYDMVNNYFLCVSNLIEWRWFSVESYDGSISYMMWFDQGSVERIVEACNRNATVGKKEIWKVWV